MCPQGSGTACGVAGCAATIGRIAVDPPPAPRPAIRIVLNADDYGLTEGIDLGILRLLEAGRLSGVSVMSTGPRWRQGAAALTPFAAQADIGLHFALTEVPTVRQDLSRNGRPFTFGQVHRLAWRKGIDRAAVLDELHRQWELFSEAFGRPPAHLDSHQHVHQLPVIRGAVLEFVRGLAAGERPYVRTCFETPATILRRGVHRTRAGTFAWAGVHLHRSLRRAGVPTNDGFSGVYDFHARQGYRALFQKFLQGLRANAIVICHPALPGKEAPGDDIAAARPLEFDYLSGPEVLADAASADVRWGRFGA